MLRSLGVNRDAFVEELSRETLRVYERYALEVVERFDFCPWARSAREAKRALASVDFAENPGQISTSLARISELAAMSETEVALIVYPLLDLDRRAFDDFARRLRNADDARYESAPAPFAMAAFHPSAQADLTHPDRLVPYVRRTPDPTLQLVRNSVLSAIRGLHGGTEFVDIEALALDLSGVIEPVTRAPTIRERIAEQNLKTVREVGAAELDTLLDDLLADREQAHAALALRHGRRGPVRRRKE